MKVTIQNNESRENYFPKTFAHLESCPHCKITRPSLTLHYVLQGDDHSEFFNANVRWAVYSCTSCSLPIGLVYNHLYNLYEGCMHEYLVIPNTWKPSEEIPDRPNSYLAQAQATLDSPDASVVMSASAIDAMLKYKGLTDGSLFKRIDQAVDKGFLTKDMSTWAHLVRLNSNNPRHADDETPHISKDA